jgi:WhiB family redox-sensing transcriptional regulator
MISPRPGLRELSLVVQVYAACAASGIDPDAWFPVSTDPDSARREAADALAVCGTCPVRARCLELSFRQWAVGQHGIWGGTLPGERKALHDRLAVLPVRAAFSGQRSRSIGK